MCPCCQQFSRGRVLVLLHRPKTDRDVGQRGSRVGAGPDTRQATEWTSRSRSGVRARLSRVSASCSRLATRLATAMRGPLAMWVLELVSLHVLWIDERSMCLQISLQAETVEYRTSPLPSPSRQPRMHAVLHVSCTNLNANMCRSIPRNRIGRTGNSAPRHPLLYHAYPRLARAFADEAARKT